MYLGETVVPYATLEPLKALLPVKHGEYEIPADGDGPGGIRLGGLERMMRGRWQTVSRMWEENKAAANELNLLRRLDYHGGLANQLEWQQNSSHKPVRILYPKAGQPTAALLRDDHALVDYTTYWVTCQNVEEAHYLLAIINSDTLASAVNQYTTPNWAGNTRDLEKHLWKLPIPEYDAADPLHREIAEAGTAAARGAAARLAELRFQRGERLTVTIARRELRAWLRASAEGAAVEEAVGRLLGGGAGYSSPRSLWDMNVVAWLVDYDPIAERR